MEKTGVSQELPQPLKRENESLDDFEHLGHDSSPLQELNRQTVDLLGLKTSLENTHVHDDKPKIDSDITRFSAEFSKFPQAGDTLLDKPLIPQKMDSNLLEMSNPFPDKKSADEKLDTFLQEMSAPIATEPVRPQNNDLHNIHSFLDNERGELKDLVQEKDEKGSHELLERYSDSEPESDDFKISKQDNFKKSNESLDPFASTESIKVKDNFKDVHEVHEPPTNNVPVTVEQGTGSKPVEDKISTEKSETNIQEKIEIEKKEPEKIKDIPPKKLSSESSIKESISQKITEAEALFCKMGLVESLIYWRDPKKSGIVFGGVLLVLLALTYFSLISVVAYLSLFALTGTIAFRIYKNIVQAVQKTGDGHPFKEYLELDVAVSQDKVKEVSEVAVAHFNAAVNELRRLFLVEDLVDSIKFGVFLWVLTYLGSWFNGMTLVIISWVALFSLPKVYETNQTQIDANLEIVRSKVADITAKVKAAIPIGKKSEEKKE